MKVKEARKIIELVESFKFQKEMKSLRNNSMTILRELEIMKKTLESKHEDDVLNSGVSNSFLRMKKQYEYLKDI